MAGPSPWAGSGSGAQTDNTAGAGRWLGVRFSAPLNRRGFRVASMLVVLILLSLTDLALTMTYVVGFGMFEANPVVLSIIGDGSPLVMVTWKLGTLLATVTILFACRRFWQAELGTGLGVVVMSALLVHWQGYIVEAEKLTNELTVLGQAAASGGADLVHDDEGPRWVSIGLSDVGTLP